MTVLQQKAEAGGTGIERDVEMRRVEQRCGCDPFYLEVHSIQCRAIRLIITAAMTGRDLGSVTIRPCAKGLDLVNKVALHLRAPVEGISLCIDENLISAFEAIGDQSIEQDNNITVIRLKEPFDHDGKMKCDGCRFSRWCYYGYSASDDYTS